MSEKYVMSLSNYYPRRLVVPVFSRTLLLSLLVKN